MYFVDAYVSLHALEALKTMCSTKQLRTENCSEYYLKMLTPHIPP